MLVKGIHLAVAKCVHMSWLELQNINNNKNHGANIENYFNPH